MGDDVIGWRLCSGQRGYWTVRSAAEMARHLATASGQGAEAAHERRWQRRHTPSTNGQWAQGVAGWFDKF